MQTIERPPSPARPQLPWTTVAGVAAGVLMVPLLLLAVFSKWGVLILVLVALTVGLGIWVWQRGFVFIEIVAFLIHFDGLGAGQIRMGRIIAAIAAVVIVVRLVKGWRPPAVPVRHWGPVWALAVWATFTGLWSMELGAYFYTFGVFGLGVAYFCVTAMLIDSHRLVQQFLRAYWVGGLFGSAAGILALFLGTRSVGFGADPNFFGLVQASMIPLTVYYRRHATSREAEWFYTVTLAVVLAGAAGAGSRSGLIGGAIAIVATMVTRPGLGAGRRAMVGVGAVFLAGIAFLVGFIANPSNLDRGLTGDRGAGRLDLWTTAIALIERQPLFGHGFGQLKALIPANLLLTPGSQMLNDLRSDVSAHNTWLDTTGDLGLVGLFIFVTIFVVALIGFVRPRWLQTRELSTTLFVMMLPVLSGSFFLPLLNNKLAWGLIGLSATLQVPSVQSRWSGMLRGGENAEADLRPALISGTASETGLELEPASAVPRRPGERPESPGEEVWEPVELARWDLRLGRRQRGVIVAVAVAGALVAAIVGSAKETTYTTTYSLWVPRLDGSLGVPWVPFDQQQFQSVLTMGVSGAYASELREQASLDLSVPEVRERLDATRPRMGNLVEISYTDSDRSNVEAVMEVQRQAFDAVHQSVRDASSPQAEDEVRPAIPGESRVYSGPTYLDPYGLARFTVNSPRTGWYVFVGSVSAGLVALGAMLAGQRRARVTSTDDLGRLVGCPVWSHVGFNGRHARGVHDQLAQVLATIVSSTRDLPRHIVVASAQRSSANQDVLLGLAAEVVARGGRALVVDADVEHQRLSMRLAGSGRAGFVDVGDDVDLAGTIHRVSLWRLPRHARRRMGDGVEHLRFIAAGRRRGAPRSYPLRDLDRIDSDVVVLILAPPLMGSRPVAALLGWADSVVIVAEAGRTATVDVENAADSIHSFSVAPAGVVLVDG